MIEIDKSWSLFLDRDGVINQKKEGYIKELKDFLILPGVLDFLVDIRTKIGYIFVVTNQQGIGKGLMNEEDLNQIHTFFLQQLQSKAGRIDAIYFAPQLEKDRHPDRKPGTGMGQRAKVDFPAIDFQKSIMVGDSKTDLLFGQKLGMHTVGIGNEADFLPVKADLFLEDLPSLKHHIKYIH